MADTYRAMWGPYFQHLPTEPLLGAGDISEPERQTPVFRGLMFQREETEKRYWDVWGA